MALKVLNIEVGKRLTKVCVTEKKGKSFSVSDTFAFGTPEGAVVDGQIVNEIVLGDKINEELKERGIDANEVYFSIASSKIASRVVTTPVVKDDQVKNIVSTNASDYFPVDISKYSVDSIILERGESEIRVMVVAVPILIIDSYIALSDYANLIIRGIDYSANSQFHVLKSVSGGEDVDMFITIDADSSSVNFSEGGNLLMQRSISVGGDEMICRYMASKEMADDEYIAALNELSINSSEYKNGNESEAVVDGIDLSDSIYRLVSGLSRSLDFFYGSNADKKIGRVIIMGSCGHLCGLKQAIAKEIGVETVWLEEIEDISGLANSINDISVYIDCLGARLAPLSLIPESYLKSHGGGQKKFINDKNFGLIGGGFCAILAIVLAAYSLGGYFIRNSKLDKIESQVAELEYADEEYKAFISYTASDDALQKFVDGSVTNNAELLAFFKELEEKMPKTLTLLSANCTEEGVTLNVTCPSFKEAAETLRQLRSFSSIEFIKVSAVTQSEEEGGVSRAHFSASCAYVVEEPETTAAPAETTEAAE